MGDAVEVEHVNGVWRAGVVTRVNPAACANYTVRYNPHGLGDYVCDYRPNLGSRPQQKGTVTLLAGGEYRYLGDRGRFRYDQASGAVTWLTGPLADRKPQSTRYHRNQTTTQLDIRFGEANEWSCGHNL